MTAFKKEHDAMLKKDKKHNHSAWLKGRFSEIKDKIQPDIQQAVEVLSQQINSWGNVPHLEIEARLGYFDLDDDGNLSLPFDSDVGQEWFNKIMKALEKETLDVKRSTTTDYSLGSCRMTVDSSGARSAMKKKTMEHSNFTYKNSPFDTRVAFSQEEPMAVKDFSKMAKQQTPTVRKKIRTSFHTNHWKYELTRVEFTNNTVDEARHEVEIEAKLDSIGYCDYVYMADSLLLKIKQLVEFCEAAEDPREMKFLKDLSKKHMVAEISGDLKTLSLNN